MNALLSELPAFSTLLLVSLVVFFAAAVQAALGMGYGLMASPILMFIEPAFVPASTILIGMLTSGFGAMREYRRIAWSEVGVAMTGRVVGMLLALILLSLVAATGQFKLVFGVLVGMAVLLTVIGAKLPHNPVNLLIMGGWSGCMGTITGVGAPPMAIIYHARAPLVARPTLAAFFAAGCATSALGLALIGWLGWQELVLCLSVLPAVFLGTWAGRRYSVSAEHRYRQGLLCLAGLSSIILIAQGLGCCSLS